MTTCKRKKKSDSVVLYGAHIQTDDHRDEYPLSLLPTIVVSGLPITVSEDFVEWAEDVAASVQAPDRRDD